MSLAPLTRSLFVPQTKLAEFMLRFKRSRPLFFPDEDWQHEAPWNILLDLYIAHELGRELTVTQVCYGSGSAQTTALRYVRLLADRQLITRYPCPDDNRSVKLCLTRQTHQAINDWIGQMNRNLDSLATGR